MKYNGKLIPVNCRKVLQHMNIQGFLHINPFETYFTKNYIFMYFMVGTKVSNFNRGSNLSHLAGSTYFST